MEHDAVKALIQAGIPGCEVHVAGEGCDFSVEVISDAFEGMPLLKQHRMVKDTVKAQLESNELHAFSIKTYTPERWAATR
ncbi:MAG: BolA/IbaG family iron-sulfur metabolism protein [Sedimenticola sp.]